MNPPPLVRFSDPTDAMAMEAERFGAPSAIGSCLAWETTSCLVVPRRLVRRAGFAEAAPELARRGFPVVVRSSGGGIVPQGSGILNLSIVVPLDPGERAPSPDFRWLCRPLRALLAVHGVGAEVGRVPGSFCDGAHNVVISGRKLAGTAQRRGRTTALLHVVLLVNPVLGPALDAIRTLRQHLGDGTPLRTDAHTSLAEHHTALSSPPRVAEALQHRFEAQLARRRHPGAEPDWHSATEAAVSLGTGLAQEGCP